MLLLGLCADPAVAATPEDGRRAYDAGRFTDAMGIWAELGHQGNAQAEFGVGLLYDLGNGVKEDPGRAFFWYQLAAEAGVPEAEFNVAAMYDAGRGVAQNSDAAALWYARAAARGHHRAQFDLAILYQDGIGVPRSPDAAAAWFHDAADGGLTAAGARLKALNNAPRPAGSLQPVTLSSPARNAAQTPADGNPSVELVWEAPAEPRPVHYEVEIRELGGPTLRTVFTASLTETAVLAPLPSKPEFYVWNVSTIAQDGSRVPSDWSWFSINAPNLQEQSMASVPQPPHADR